MANINSVTLSGNLTRDPELRTLPSGTELCEFGIAVNESRKTDDGYEDVPHFFDVKVWGNFGNLCARKLAKGTLVSLSGRLQQERWETEDGSKRSKVVIVARDITSEAFFVKGGEAPAAAAPAEAQQSIADDDIPF